MTPDEKLALTKLLAEKAGVPYFTWSRRPAATDLEKENPHKAFGIKTPEDLRKAAKRAYELQTKGRKAEVK